MKTPEAAYNSGYRPLTVPYIEEEAWMLDNVVEDMERGSIDYILVAEGEGVSVWRKGMIEL